MAWLLNREEKEDFIIRLYKEGKTVRDIARLAHMSFRDIGTIINKVKLQADRERGYTAEDTQPKSPESKAFKMFSEGKSPIEVAIALDLGAGRVQAIYQDYWSLSGRYKLVQIYDEAKYDIYGLLGLHNIVKNLGMNEEDVKNVLDIAKHNELQNLQWKAEYLRNEINMLEQEKANATHHIFKLDRTMDEPQSSLEQRRGEMAHMHQGTGWYDNTDNLRPIPYSGPYTNSYSLQHNNESGWYDYPSSLYSTYSKSNVNSYSIRLSYSSYQPWDWILKAARERTVQ